MVHLLWISVRQEDFPVFRWLYSFRRQFHLVDSIGKKIKVGQAVAEAIGLKNVTFRHCRAEEEKQLFDFVVSRAVMPLGRPGQNIPQKCKERTAERIAQRIDMSERR